MKMNGLQSWVNWIIGVLIIICGSNIQIAYSIINDAIQQDLSLSVTQISLAASVNMFFFAIFQLFTGTVIDYYNIRKILPFSLFFIIVGTLLLYYTKNFTNLLLSQIILSFGASFSFVGAGYISSKCFSYTRFGIMFGLAQTFYSISALVGQYLCTILTFSGLHWKLLVNYINYFSLIILIISIWLLKDPDKHKNRRHLFININKISSCILNILKVNNLWITTIICSISFGTFLAIAVLWGPKILKSMNFNANQAGIATSITWLGFAIGSPIIPYISNLLKNRKQVLLFFYIIQPISIIALLYNQKFYIECIFMSILGFSSGTHMLNFVIANDIVKSNKIGTISSIINAVMSATSGIIISLIAILADQYQKHYQIKTIILIISFTIILSSTLLYFTKDTYHKTNYP